MRGLIVNPALLEVLTLFSSLHELSLRKAEKSHQTLSSLRWEAGVLESLARAMKWPLFPGPPIHAASVPLADEGLDWYLIIGICVGGAVFLLFVALLIFYISRRKKQSRRRDGKLPLLLSHRRPG